MRRGVADLPSAAGRGDREPSQAGGVVDSYSDGTGGAPIARLPTTIASPAMPRVLTGVRPTGQLHLGNYCGAIRHFLRFQHFQLIQRLHIISTGPRIRGDSQARSCSRALKRLEARSAGYCSAR